MKYYSKRMRLNVKLLFLSGLLAASVQGIAQNRQAVIADAKLGQIAISDITGYQLDPNSIQQEQLINLKLPVESITHGNSLPAGTCKIKIGFGSKLVMDPGFDINSAGMESYFKWTSVVNGGQLQVTGDLVRELPANISAVNVTFRVKASGVEGKSTITANFLITNHNSTTILSDEDGANNSSYLSYNVIKKFDLTPVVPNGNLKLSVFPNPANDVKSVVIKVVQGRLNGKYKISLYDITGKLIQTRELQMNFTTNFNYDFGELAAGNYLIKVASSETKDSSVLKFEKL